ncbi:MAG TPA: Ada metal-binding domain-containing protein [Terriglobales bacterium]|nr:Ada metal-binding domain-containing protein [Terriglobales bacterium]
MSQASGRKQWPTGSDYSAAIQNPAIAFADSELKSGTPVLDRLGMPLVQAGNFAFVFKFQLAVSSHRALKCFRQEMGDRERRYKEITAYLDQHDLSALPHFDYDQTGILVAGERYPLLVMDWIAGNALDVYVGKIIDAKQSAQALPTLAARWAELIKQLEDAKVAHGDLQHGNVIVTDAGLRLVDLDGMFVPSLRRFQAGELGHIHFQPPWRTAAQFDDTIDRFPALVIYLSLIALSKLPQLWERYHDDNLIFTKDDFRDPGRSSLFQELRRADGKISSLAQILAEACLRPNKTPPLSALVQTKVSKLPAWMRDDQIVHVETITRESQAQPKPLSATPATPADERPWWISATPSVSPSTSAPAQSAAQITNFATAREVFSQSAKIAAMYGACGLLLFWIWIPLFQWLLAGFGGPPNGSSIPVLLYVWFCACAGLGTTIARRSKVVATAQAAATASPHWTGGGTSAQRTSSSTSTSPGSATSYAGTWSSSRTQTAPSQGQPAPQRTTQTASSGPPVVGSQIRLIYHRPSCSWAHKISARNRVTFGSAAAARAGGYRPCRVCSPY